MLWKAATYRWIWISAVLAALWPEAAAAQSAAFPPSELNIRAPAATSSPVDRPAEAVAIPSDPINTEILRPEIQLKTWWHDALLAPIGPADQALPMELERAVVQALSQSARVHVMRDTAAISATTIPQAQATFDPVSFLESRFTDTSDPVGNKLTTGGSPRFIDEQWYSSGGVKKQALTGAQLELAQRLGFENNNSTFFVPKNQATAKLTMNITQPLLRGAGTAYNSGVVVLATVDVQIARANYCTDLQKYLVDFHSSFWDIYAQRAILLQRRRLLHEAREILQELELRRDVDVQVSQLARARAAVGNREAALLRYEAAVKNSVSRFKALVNDPFLDNPSIVELIPLDSPDAGFGDADLNHSLTTALDHRPEIEQALQEIRGASKRLDLAKNEVLPLLNLVMGSYVYGLQGQSAFATAYGDQFSVGRPTYWAGIVYERPFGNRGPRAARDQRMLELQRATSQLRVVTASVRAEVEIAVREITTTRGEMLSRHQAMLSEQDQVNYLLQRWRLLAGDQQVAGVVFNDLLDAQDRRATAEFDFVTSQVAHRVAWINLRRAMGTLCDCSAVTVDDLAASVNSPVPVAPNPNVEIPSAPKPIVRAAGPVDSVKAEELPPIIPLPPVGPSD